MQTFLPYQDFIETAKCLDNKRLGKQRSEAKTILNILTGKSKFNKHGKITWINHPAVQMWRGYENSLRIYYNTIVKEWIRRGYQNNMELEIIDYHFDVQHPYWLGNKKFHDSHKSKLLEKDIKFYSKYGWDVKIELPYLWPTKEEL